MFVSLKTINEKSEQQKQINLQGEEVAPNDNKIGAKSALKALGSGNPATIAVNGKVEGTVTIQGSEAITNMMGAVTDIVGRAKQAYVVGQGLSQEGAKLLGAKLANMTIGDIESMLDTKNIDPFLVVKLMNELKDLARALVIIRDN
ncbi:hypothetical protein KUTeg_002242 [Tegillarca granosa]|uniref:Uncharacterized protein n=1 Tax=Tegillarca granosa TaxID=220873 RepID=A0ABQ9FY48_TEGGR|nr:hypothetical protein KUTeg_002242 [Tegillarca granosa]